MINSANNLKAIVKIAEALEELNDQVIFVGGSVVGLYINDPAAEDVRPTKDVDVSADIATFGELEKIRQQLVKKGFKQSHEEKVVCRFLYQGIKLDVMGTKEVGWAPSNPWFGPGFKHIEKQKIDAITINILPLAYFLATKFTAFHGRGGADPRFSHDFEDITYILDNKVDLVESVTRAPDDVKKYLRSEFRKILKGSSLQEAIIANLNHLTQTERYNAIVSKLEKFVTGK
ncbi:MAG: nucleotidyl transferase AbiEii/AbiGii toxin family protein [bacterium]|nr:nucleotidyl transferase AbiEii/AbiGii toxin family protein [bacterium]